MPFLPKKPRTRSSCPGLVVVAPTAQLAIQSREKMKAGCRSISYCNQPQTHRETRCLCTTMMHGEPKHFPSGAYGYRYTGVLSGLVAYNDDSQSESEERTNIPSTSQSENTDVRAFFAQSCYGHFPLCWLCSVWDRISHRGISLTSSSEYSCFLYFIIHIAVDEMFYSWTTI